MGQSPYGQLVERIRRVVVEMVPRGATVLVVSRGDPELVRMPGREACHFPRDAQGRYAGYHPASSTAAIAHLEASVPVEHVPTQ